jgi:hypothetical protein
MRKNYYLVYASPKAISEIVALLSRQLSIEFEPHESSYVGDYFKYSGYYADRLSVEPVQDTDREKLGRDKLEGARSLVFVQHTTGKNADRKAKSSHLRRCLDKITDLSLIRESVVDEHDD